MPAKWIKIGRDGLVGRVLAYVKEPNVDGKHEAVIAASSMPELIRLYMQLLGKEETPESQEFLEFLENADKKTDFAGAANYKTTLDSICGLRESFDCDILEIYARPVPGICTPQPIQEGIREMRDELSVSELYTALNDYFSAYAGAILETDPFPTYTDCTRQEWKNILFEVHESLVNPELMLDYDIVERDLQRLCSGSGVSEKIVSELCEVAKNGFSERIKLLCFYRELIFAIEDKRYEDAADLRNKIIKIKN